MVIYDGGRGSVLLQCNIAISIVWLGADGA